VFYDFFRRFFGPVSVLCAAARDRMTNEIGWTAARFSFMLIECAHLK